MSSSSKVYYRNFLTMLSGNTVSQLIPFIIAPILSRTFSKEEFAVVANFMAIVSVIGVVSTGRLELAIPLPDEKKRAQGIVFTGFMFTITLGLLSILLPIFSFQIGKLYNDHQLPHYLSLVPLAVISFGLLGLVNNWNLRNERFHLLSVGKISQSIINNGLAALLGYIGWGIDGLIIAWLIAQYATIIVLLIGVNPRVKKTDFSILTIKSTLREYKDFPLINSLHAFSDIFFSQFLLFWLISTYFGIAELGLFAIMNKYVRAPMVLVSLSVSQLFYVEAGKSLNSEQSILPVIKKTLKTSFLFALPFVFGILFFGPLIFKWYLGDKWEMAGTYAQYLLPIIFIYFITSPISGLPILLNEQKKAFAFSVIGYSSSILALFLATKMGFDFGIALLFYSSTFCVYNMLILYWFYTLVKRQEKSILIQQV